MNQASKSPLPGTRITARAFFVAERINTAGLERGDVWDELLQLGLRFARRPATNRAMIN